MSDKVAVYAGTQNIYPRMYTALKSLLLNNNMDRVYLLIETDEFPYPVPENVIVVNVSDQPWFPANGANTKSRYTYMALLKCVLGEMFQEEKKILWLDCDTIVDDDITDIFEINLNSYYYAGVMEPGKSKDVFRYINVGVLLCNLDQLRRMGKEPELVAFLNNLQMNLPDQEVINLLCQGRIRIIDSIYNANPYVTPCVRPKVYHYAAMDNYTEQWLWKKYEDMSLFAEEEDDDDTEQE